MNIFPNMLKNLDFQTQEAQQTPNKIKKVQSKNT